MFNVQQSKLGQTWVEIDGEICGATPDERGPIGGGVGYTGFVTPKSISASTRMPAF